MDVYDIVGRIGAEALFHAHRFSAVDKLHDVGGKRNILVFARGGGKASYGNILAALRNEPHAREAAQRHILKADVC